MIKASLYNIKAESLGDIKLPSNYFEAKISDDLIHQAIRVFLNNQRKANAKSLGRGEVSGTTKKMWAQKGTGRARHGSAKAPIFVGGGKAHGPRGVQNYTLKMTKSMRQSALRSILSKFAQEKSIIVIDKFSDLTPKTKEGLKLITGLKAQNKVLSESRKIGIITAGSPTVKRVYRNLKKVNLLNVTTLNTYDLTNQDCLIISKKALLSLEK